MLVTNNIAKFISGKSLISKEKALQTSEKEEDAENMGLKPKAVPVFFISLVGADFRGDVQKEEGIYDIYTKEYDFKDSAVMVKSAQDLWDDYAQNNGSDRKSIDIYALVEHFVQQHPDAHFILDECPFLLGRGK